MARMMGRTIRAGQCACCDCGDADPKGRACEKREWAKEAREFSACEGCPGDCEECPDEISCLRSGCYNSWDETGVADEWNVYPDVEP